MCGTARIRHCHHQRREISSESGLFDGISSSVLQRFTEQANAADMRRKVLQQLGRYPADRDADVIDIDTSADGDSVDSHALPDPE